MLKMLGSSMAAFALVLLTASPSWAHPAYEALFQSTLAKYLLTSSESGAYLIGRVTGACPEHISEGVLTSFRARMRWRQARPLRDQLGRDLIELKTKFAEYRKSKNRPEELTSDEILVQEDAEWLESQARAIIRSAKYDNLIEESMIFIEVPRTPHVPISQRAATRLALAPGNEIPTPGTNATSPAAAQLEAMIAQAVPPSPQQILEEAVQAGNTHIDLDAATLTWKQSIMKRLEAYTGFVRTFQLSEASISRLFRLTGKSYTVEDLRAIQRWNRRLDALNPFMRARLLIRGFAMQRPYLYAQLNEKTAEALTKYMDGAMSIEEFATLREAAAKELGLPPIVVKAEVHMLSSLERLRVLGGGRIGSMNQRSLIDIAEDNFLELDARLKTLAEKIEWTEMDVTIARHEGRVADARALERQINYWRAEHNDITRVHQNADDELRELYFEFTEHYEGLPLFLNLRNGRILREEIQSFDMHDIFVATRHEAKEWKDIYDRALYNSLNKLVLQESKLFYATRVGATRKYINETNELMGRYFGKNIFTRKWVGQKITDSPIGKRFLKFNRSIATSFALRTLKAMGFAVPASCTADAVAGTHNPVCDWVNGKVLELWNRIWGTGTPENEEPVAGEEAPAEQPAEEPARAPRNRRSPQ